MQITVRNLTPTILHIPDANLRLNPDEEQPVSMVTEQMRRAVDNGLLAIHEPAPIEPAGATIPAGSPDGATVDSTVPSEEAQKGDPSVEGEASPPPATTDHTQEAGAGTNADDSAGEPPAATPPAPAKKPATGGTRGKTGGRSTRRK